MRLSLSLSLGEELWGFVTGGGLGLWGVHRGGEGRPGGVVWVYMNRRVERKELRE